jgi:hypothetical protein
MVVAVSKADEQGEAITVSAMVRPSISSRPELMFCEMMRMGLPVSL